MKIGFDISQTGRHKAGCGVFADGLIRALLRRDDPHEYLLYPTFGDSFWDPDWADGTFQSSDPRVTRMKGHRSLADAHAHWASLADADRALGHPDVVQSNNFFCPTGLQKARLVYTLYDTAVLDVPEYATEANRLVCFEGTFRATLCADHVIAISGHTRQRFLAHFPYYPAERVSVVYPASRYTHGPAAGEAPVGSLEPERFWLAVGTLEPRKNYPALLRAYARHAASHQPALPLVIAGGNGWMLEDFTAQITALGLQDRVRLLGYTSDEALAWLMGHCYALVYPSLYEGFGLPVLEAMSLGAPVIASSVTSLPEIVGDAGLLIEPTEPAIAEALDLFAANRARRDDFAARSVSQAGRFSWDAAAQALLTLYERVVTMPRYAERATVGEAV